MLEIRVIMNSTVEDVISFKCCNLHDQNLEIHLKNTGSEVLEIPNACELVGEEGRYRIEYLYPAGPYRLEPGEVTACYCTLADEVFDRHRRIVFTDTQGRRYEAPLREEG